MGMVLLSEDEVGSCSSKASLLKKSLSQMKSLFCKEIDSHLKKIKSPKKSPSHEKEEAKSSLRCPLKDTLVIESIHSHMSPNKREGKENALLGRRRKRKRFTSSLIHNGLHKSKKYNTRKNAAKRKEADKNPYPLIKAFRKSPHKFDPRRIIRPDDDPLPSPSHKALRKKGIKKKLELEGKMEVPTFIPVNRKANIVEGDYLSHGRQYFHVRTNGKILHGEPESEESYQWIPDLMTRQIDEFLDLNGGEKELIKMWNEHIILEPAYGSEMLSLRLKEFIENKGELIASKGLYKNFLLHLTNLYEHEVLDQEVFLELVLKQQNIMSQMEKKPWFDQWREKPLKGKERKKEPSLPPPRTVPSSWFTKKKKKPKNNNAALLRVSSRRRSSVLKMTSDVTVKFWGAGDYSSIKDVNQMPSLKRKFENTSEFSGSVKRRKISNGGALHNSSSSCIEVT